MRPYELDANGHVNHAVYHQYGEVARTSLAEAAGVPGALYSRGIGVVMLESHIHFRRELRYGDVVTVSCVASYDGGKVFAMNNEVHKADGTLSAEIRSTLGLLDLDKRKLVADPLDVMKAADVDVDLLRGG